MTAPTFQENLLSFGVCYGLGDSRVGQKRAVHTNLLPKEILNDRLVNRKKPWAVAAAAVFLLGLAFNYFWYSQVLGDVDPNIWQAAGTQAETQGKGRPFESRLRSGL